MKNKKFFLFAIAVSAVLTTVIFAVSLLINENKKAQKPAAIPPSREKTTDEIIDSLTAPAKEGEKSAIVSEEVIKSLTAPIKTSADSAVDSKNNKDVIKSLTAPAVK